MMDNLQEEIIELQTKIQFQEDTIQQLDKIIADQNQRIDALSLRLSSLDEKVKDLMQQQNAAPIIQDERPPHY